MSVVYKYPLKWEPAQVLTLPYEWEFLRISIQDNALFLWALVDPEAPVEVELFYIVGTGRQLPEEQLEYLATVDKRPFVWHIFRRTSDSSFKLTPLAEAVTKAYCASVAKSPEAQG